MEGASLLESCSCVSWWPPSQPSTLLPKIIACSGIALITVTKMLGWLVWLVTTCLSFNHSLNSCPLPPHSLYLFLPLSLSLSLSPSPLLTAHSGWVKVQPEASGGAAAISAPCVPGPSPTQLSRTGLCRLLWGRRHFQSSWHREQVLWCHQNQGRLWRRSGY